MGTEAKAVGLSYLAFLLALGLYKPARKYTGRHRRAGSPALSGAEREWLRILQEENQAA